MFTHKGGKESKGGWKIREQHRPHFVTLGIVGWADVFVNTPVSNVIVKSLCFCHAHKGLLIHSWCIMSNHLHLILSSSTQDLSDIIRDFKRHTAREIVRTVNSDWRTERRDWLLDLFRRTGEKNSRNESLQVWMQHNHPIEVENVKLMVQKLDYIHYNPVKAGIVDKPEDYLKSSARDYFERRQVGPVPVNIVW